MILPLLPSFGVTSADSYNALKLWLIVRNTDLPTANFRRMSNMFRLILLIGPRHDPKTDDLYPKKASASTTSAGPIASKNDAPYDDEPPPLAICIASSQHPSLKASNVRYPST